MSKRIPYIVKQGDSLWKISKKYSVSIEEIIKANKLSSPRSLKINQKIFIPRHYQKESAFFLWPLDGEIINFFGENIRSSINKGLNIRASSQSKNVKASAEGEVVFASHLKGWGKTVILKHRSSYYTIYANLDDVTLREKAFAKKGQTIGEVGCGKNGNYILHFEIRKKYIPQDPLRYLN